MSESETLDIRLAGELLAAGKFAEADAALERALKGKPDSVDALHLLSVSRAQRGRTDEALELVERALELDPRSAGLHCSMGNILRLANRREEAKPQYLKGLAIDPKHPECHANLGHLLNDDGRDEEAIRPLRRAVELGIKDVQVFRSLGSLHAKLNRKDELEECFRGILGSNPPAEVSSWMGNVLLAVKCNKLAAECFQAALCKRPDHAEDLGGLGAACRELFWLNEAAESLQKAIELDPSNYRYYLTLGAVLLDFRRPEAAIAAYESARSLAPEQPEVYIFASVAYWAMNQLEETVALLNKALALEPNSPGARHNLGVALFNLNQPRQSLEQYAIAASLSSEDNPGVRFSQAVAHLMLGEFRPGFELFEARWTKDRVVGAKSKYALPQSLGPRAQYLSDLDGKVVLVLHEQGAGDTLHFIRYAPLLKHRAQRVIFHGPQSLIELLQETPALDELVPYGQPIPKFDVYTPVLSLPRLFGTTLETIPAEVPYLKVHPARLAAWEARLAGLPGRRIGIAWSGNPEHENDHNRSISLGTLEPLLRTPGISFVSLQKELRETDGYMAAKLGLLQFGDDLRDFADTAALCSCLDLVISVDTSVAHLAGGLGKSVWVLLPFNGEWRWMLDREDSPWYPTARLFRQPKLDDWHSVIQRVRRELEPEPAKSGLRRLFRR